MILNEVTPPGVPDKDVKAMKPSFQKQYGSRWKKVLYSTLWKKHGQKEELSVQEMREYIWEHAHEDRKEIKEGKRALAIHNTESGNPRARAWLDLDVMSDDLVEHHYMNIRKVLQEDAVDDQLKKHGLSRAALVKKVVVQRQQFQGRPNPPQHAVKEGK